MLATCFALWALVAVLASFSLGIEPLGMPGAKEDPARYGVVPFFQDFNDRLGRFELLEKRGINSGFSVILVRATPPSDQMGRISGSSLDFNDEAFGVFIVSDKIGKSILTLDIFPTERMWDYEIGIEKISENFLLLWRKGATYGDVADKVKYFFDLSEKKLIRIINHVGTNFSGMALFQGSLYFLATDAYKPSRIDCLKAPDRCDYSLKSLIVRLESPDRYQEAQAYAIIDSISRQDIPKLDCISVKGQKLLLEGDEWKCALSGGRWKLEKKPLQTSYRYGSPGKIQVNSTAIEKEAFPFLRDDWFPCLAKAQIIMLGGESAMPRKFLIWNSQLSDRMPASGRSSGIYEDSPRYNRFHPIPQPSYDLFARYRPGRVKNGYTRDVAHFEQEVGPAQLFEKKIWFGTSFYDGEGTTGIGGIGYFDIALKKYYLTYHRDIADWSTSAIYVDQDHIWMGLMRRPEGVEYGGGLARYDRKTKTFKKYRVSNIVTSIRKYNGALFMTTTDGLYIFSEGVLKSVEFNLGVNGKYSAAVKNVTDLLPEKAF